MTRAEIVAEARTWLGTRFRHQASLKGVGADCIGLIAGVARACAVPEALQWDADPRRTAYTRQADAVMLVGAADTYLRRIRIDEALPADILLLRFEFDPQHFALVSAPDYVIHAYAVARRVVENRVDELWRSRIMRAYRFRAL